MTLTRTSDRLPRKRYGIVEFDQGERETDEYDAETEEWAADTFYELERDSGPDVDATDEERTVEDEAARVVEEIEAEAEAGQAGAEEDEGHDG